MIRQAAHHRWGLLDGRMLPAKVVVSKEQGQGRFMIRPFLAESIGEPRQTPVHHAHCQVEGSSRVGEWRGGVGVALTVAAPFGWRAGGTP